ncbi:RNA binding protein [Aspergillus bombycis]|uniref:RNA binding protein n=1 Tax=Aspergillus bombycis TaxID=109264 RepID=A0A1F8A1Z4_9EURO|nr:RNA binding protein [Aspergillus bombycis]OGM45750.1 RNA binding protein [Aspergillus bombycis]
MLKPFQIRDLHRSSSQDNLAASQNLDHAVVEDRSTLQSHHQGIVRLSATEYDEITTNHPRARLTYVDDDDDELITVGSSLELSQRLEEPIDTSAIPQPTLDSIAPEPMHIFDIRRSNSVKNLWKKFEYKPHLEDHQGRNEIGTVPAAADTSQSNNSQEEPDPSCENPGPATTDVPEPLLAAFEAEMARILNTTGTVRDGNAQPDPPVETPARAESNDRRQHPSDAFIHALHNLVEGAEMIGAGVRSRLPEFERQLQNVQRTLPEHVESSVQVALAALDSQARNLIQALNNASVIGGQRAGNLFHTELPTPAATIEGLRNMASELGHMGNTLFEAFESEFRCNVSRSQDQGAPGNSQPTELTAGAQPDISATLPEAQQSTPAANCENEKEPLGIETRTTPSTQVGSPESSVLPTNRNADPSMASHQQPGSSSPTLPPSPEIHTQFPSLWNRPQPLPHRPHLSSRNVRPSFATPNMCYPPPPFPVPPHLPPVFWPHHGPPPPHGHPHGPPPPPPPHGFLPHPPHPHAHAHGPPRAPHHGPFYPPTSALPVPPRPPRHRHRDWPASHHRQNENGAPAPETIRHSEHDLPSTASFAGTSLFIGNVGFGVHEAMIRDVFASKGFLVDVHLPLDAETGRHAGFGYLRFPSIHAAKAALDALQGAHIDGHSINLEISDHPPITTLDTSQGREEHSNQPPAPSELQSSSIAPTRVRQASEPQTHGENGSSHKQRSAPLAVADLCSSNIRQSRTPSSETSLVGSSLLDSERLNTLYPSLLPEGSPQQPMVSNNTSTQLPDLSREPEERRFPPVSQLDAHFLAERRGGAESSSEASTSGNRSTLRRSVGGDSHDSLYKLTPQNLPGAFPQDPQDSYQPRPSSLETDATQQQNNNDRMSASCYRRRPRTVRSFHPSRRHSGPWDTLRAEESHDNTRPLRRRATERHSLRDDREMGSTNTFNRRSYRSDAMPRPSTSTAENGAGRQRSIDDCVSALASLGYGGAEEGGLQRIAVYAAAVDGRVSDAIEMIEEERKAYEQKGSMRVESAATRVPIFLLLV